jgi:hypothetical protein
LHELQKFDAIIADIITAQQDLDEFGERMLKQIRIDGLPILKSNCVCSNSGMVECSK